MAAITSSMPVPATATTASAEPTTATTGTTAATDRAAAPATEERDLPRCKCGTTRHDPHAAPQREYSMLGAIYLLWGGTCVPSRVNFCCVLCGETFDAVTGRSECY